MDLFGSTNAMLSHVALAGLVLPFLFSDMTGLRLAATAGGLLLIGIFVETGGDAIAGGLWAFALVAVNGFRVYQLRRDLAEAIKMPKQDDDPMLRLALSGLNDTQISRLMKAAEVQLCEPGQVLTKQGKQVNSLYFLYAGKANVEVDGKPVAALENGAFIGEIAYLTSKPATATVKVDKPSRVLTFSRARLAQVTGEDPHISGIIFELLGRDLAKKMGRANANRSGTGATRI